MNKFLFIIILFLFPILFFSCSSRKDVIKLEPNEIIQICDMAVLKCFYHNTAEIKNKKTGKRQWLEYDSTIKLGIDASRVRIDIKDNIVTVQIPKIKVLGDPDIDETTIKILTDQTGIIKTKFTNDERYDAIAVASEDTIKSAENNSLQIRNAETRVKKIIESYINQIGSMTGINYTIYWESTEEA